MDRPDPNARYRKPSESSGARLRSAGGLDRIALRPARDASMRMPASRHGHPHRCVLRQCRHRLRRRHRTRRQRHTVIGHVTRQSRLRCASANGSESESSRHAIVCQSAGSGRTAVKPYFIHSAQCAIACLSACDYTSERIAPSASHAPDPPKTAQRGTTALGGCATHASSSPRPPIVAAHPPASAETRRDAAMAVIGSGRPHLRGR